MSGRSEKNLYKLEPLQFWRHFIQILTFIFLNGKLFGIASTGIIVPYLWAMGAPFSTVHGAYESLEYTLAQGVFPLLVLGVIYLTAITVGRIFCGWACPFGMIQDFLCYLPFQKEKLSPQTITRLSDIKWGILGFSILMSSILGYNRATSIDAQVTLKAFTETPFALFSPSATLFTYLPWLLLWNSNALAHSGMVGWMKFALFIAVMVPSIYIPRFFCRFVCPMGAMLEGLSNYKILRISKSPKLSRDELNKTLKDVCPMEIQISDKDDSEFISDSGCIHCGRCVVKHPKHTSQTIF